MVALSLNLLLPFFLLQSAQSCLPPDASSSNNISNPQLVRGTDAPADIRTLGYFINHLSLNVNNLTRSIEFYTSVFGMRHMFTYHLTPRLSFTYLTHSAGGRNGTGYQTTQELIRDKNNAAGAIELVHFSPRDKKDIEGPKTRTGTFSHVGIIVPNPKATQERLKEFGVRIYKEVGAEMPTEGPLSNPFYLGDATNLSEEEFEEIRVGMGKLNMLNIFAEDPDGNLLEIQPADEGGLFG